MDYFTEKELFEKLSEKLENLISEFTINKFIDKGGQYKKITVHYENKTELERLGVEMFELYYYFYLRIFCFQFSPEHFRHGIYTIRFKQNLNFDMWVLPPGKL